MQSERVPNLYRSLKGAVWERRVAILIGSLLTVAIFIVYWQVRSYDFVVMDDLVYVSDNPHVLTGFTSQNVGWAFTTFHAGFWIPLTWLSFMVDAQIAGAGAGAYHVTNVLLHVANTLLVFAFLANATGKQIRSAFVAALFALHPLHVESVAWVTERKDVLSTLFGLLSLLAYVRSVKGAAPLEFDAFLFLLVCSLAAKPTLVTLPFVFLLLDYWPLRRYSAAGGTTATAAKLVGEKLPCLAASVSFSVITYVAQHRQQAVETLAGYPLSTRTLNALVVYVAYLRKTIVPTDLAIFYPHPRGQLAANSIVLAAAVLLFISVAAVIWARRYPFLLVGWCWYLGTLVPMIGIVQVGRQQMADRFTYFPSIGLFLSVVWLTSELAPAGVLCRRILPATGIAALIACAAMSFIQVAAWKDSVSLFRHAIVCGQDMPSREVFLEARWPRAATCVRASRHGVGHCDGPGGPRVRIQPGGCLADSRAIGRRGQTL